MTSKRSNTHWWVIGSGCVGCLGIIVLVAVGFGWLFFQGRSDLTPITEEFLVAAESGRYEAAYDMTGETWQETQTLDQFRAFCTLVNNTLGERHSLTSRGFAFHSGTQGRTAKATYFAKYEHDDVTITVSLKKYADQWKVDGCHYGSKLFSKDRVCPDCGSANDAAGQYCSQCGVQLEEPQQPTVEELDPGAP